MISVILPVYNAEKTISRTIQSLLVQSESNFELIICNDGSKDNTQSIIQGFNDPRIKLISQDNLGVIAAHNKALELAQGKYIARMDADDECHQDRLSLQKQYLDNHPHILACFSQVKFKSNIQNAQGFEEFVNWNNSLCSPEEILLNRFVEMPVVNPSVMMRRETINQFGTYEELEFPEDYEYWLRILNHGSHLAKLPQKLLTWHDSEGRLTRSDELYDVERFYQCKALYIAKELEKRQIKEVNILGGGIKSRKRAHYLDQYGIEIHHYIDIAPKRIGQKIAGRWVLDYNKPETYRDKFFLSYVSNRGSRKVILDHLTQHQFIHGRDYLFCS